MSWEAGAHSWNPSATGRASVRSFSAGHHSDPIRLVAGILAANRIHAVVVASPDEATPSVVTDRDVVFGHARGNLDRLTVRDAASEPTITVRADLDLRDASEAMSQHGTTHIVVTALGDGRPIGVLSSLDIANAVGAK